MKRRMINRRIGIGLMSLTLLALANVCNARTTAAPTNTLTFSETLSDKIVCANDEGDWYCDMFTKDSFTISATVLLSGVDITQFDGDILFDLSVGGLDVPHFLNDDPKYTPVKTSATFVETYVDDNDREHIYQTVKLKWTATQLTVTIKGKTSDIFTSGLSPILAYDYDGVVSGPINNTISGSIVFGDVSVDFDPVTVTGTVLTKDVTTKDKNELFPSTVKIKGSGVGAQSP
jgi:hypothetical protein